MQETLYLVKELRPAAKWGYYAYPYCFNMAQNNMESDCSQQVVQENDRIKWLFTTSTAYYPSLYFSQSVLTSEKMIIQMIQGRLKESQRIISTLNKVPTKPKVLPYIWLKYRDTNEYMTKEDLSTIIMVLKSMKADGVIIWGSSKDVNSKKSCQLLHDYVENVLGPILLGY
ncbi:glycoside hydrolase [Oryctes borbonicus]|uniref:Hyaluronidase n=1 Tax=Oryctes borbonicus TaxID=1629725 RepID=A0A0T6BHG7_9SCAR|nr:glycoside hydrolase [Oryctes borbonicus]